MTRKITAAIPEIVKPPLFFRQLYGNRGNRVAITISVVLISARALANLPAIFV
jgi:hypothetical protein